MKKYDISDYSQQLQDLCGCSTLCKKCIKRGKNTLTNHCLLKKVAFELAKKKNAQQQESED